jgi:hypothetical protein
MRRTFAGAIAGLVALGSAGMVAAAPPDAETFEIDCDGTTYEIWTNGVGDFTPGHIVGSPGGGDPESFDETIEKGNGNAMKHRELTVCTLEFSFEDPESGASGEGTSETGVVVRGR